MNFIGKSNWNKSENVNAIFDEIKIYKGALSKEEIKLSYDPALNPTTNNTSNTSTTDSITSSTTSNSITFIYIFLLIFIFFSIIAAVIHHFYFQK